jgi:leucyl-tRNA synthetase
MLAPLAPHVGEELWSRLGHTTTLAYEPYPSADRAKLAVAKVTMVVQVNGKPRERLEVDPGISEEDAVRLAVAAPKVAAVLAGATPTKVVARPPRIVNVVV